MRTCRQRLQPGRAAGAPSRRRWRARPRRDYFAASIFRGWFEVMSRFLGGFIARARPMMRCRRCRGSAATIMREPPPWSRRRGAYISRRHTRYRSTRVSMGMPRFPPACPRILRHSPFFIIVTKAPPPVATSREIFYSPSGCHLLPNFSARVEVISASATKGFIGLSTKVAQHACASATVDLPCISEIGQRHSDFTADDL